MSIHQLDALELSDAVRQRLVDFSLDACFVNDAKLTEICKTIWSGRPENGGLVSDLWVEGAFPAKSAEESLEKLVKQGQFNQQLGEHLHKNNAVPKERPLYLHQRNAILQAQENYPNEAKPAIVVMAGTGAGKTESFLLPILNKLFNQPVTKNNQGVKCLILYPMNALVNDQVERVYEWLKGQSHLTLFHFTSETPEDKSVADQEGVPKYEPCRIRTRQQARGKETPAGKKIEKGRVPDILITNYSMLEYMLCRPQDAVFFGQSLQAVVLDEAHFYTGTLAAEITLLLRRLYQRCGVASEKVLQMATSATLGGKKDDVLRNFIATLFTKSEELVQVIQGEHTRVQFPPPTPPLKIPQLEKIVERKWLEQPTIRYENERGYLAEDKEQCQSLLADLPLLVDSSVVEKHQSLSKPAELLYETLRYAPLIQQIEEILWDDKRLTLRALAKKLWQIDDEKAIQALIALLRMGASARQKMGDYPLLPHRIHLLARSTEGLVVCLNEQCSGDEKLKLARLGCVSAGFHEQCPYCQSATLSLHRCDNCGEWLLVGMEKEGNLYAISRLPNQDKTSQYPIYYLSLNTVENSKGGYGIDRKTGRKGAANDNRLKVYDLTLKDKQGKKEIRPCPNCHEGDAENFKPFMASSSLTLSILAETALAKLPELPTKYNNRSLPAQGRRMLVFSDSRREAAKLGPTLSRQHETQVLRTAIVECLQASLVVDSEYIKDLENDIHRLETELTNSQLTPAQRGGRESDLQRKQQELKESREGGALERWASSMSQLEITQQLLNYHTSEIHSAEGWWKDGQWEDNFKKLKGDLPFLLKQELARAFIDAASPEAMGLAEVTFPRLNELNIPGEFVGGLPTQISRKELEHCWTDLLIALCHSLRNASIVTLGSDKEDDEYQFKNARVGLWCSEEQTGTFLNNFVTKERSRRYRFVKRVLQKCGLSETETDKYTPELLRTVFNQLLNSAAGQPLTWLEIQSRRTYQNATVNAIRILLPKLGLRRPQQLYRCPVTHRIFTYSVLGCAVESAENKDLEPVTEELLDQDPRIGRQRREYKDSPVFKIGLWAEEHSAQLSPKENRRLQDLFKAGMRNILSSTTTLELGIDIGGLNAALMGNVPPGKANYLQRAGRAGRRADGSAVVITYCRPSPFDREVFLRFGDYLTRELRAPNVFLDRERILKRHAHAFLLGEFFRTIHPPTAHVGAMEAFGKMGKFCGVVLPSKWDGTDKPLLPEPKSGLDELFVETLRQDSAFKPIVEQLYMGGTESAQQTLLDWNSFIGQVIENFQAVIKEWKKDYSELLKAWKDSSMKAQTNAIRYQLKALYEMTVIEALADGQFLPRYGFPIGVHKLGVFEPDEHTGRVHENEDKYRLERPGLLALGEYVPGSQLLVGGKLITSHGLLKHWTGVDIDSSPDLRGDYAICQNEHLFYEIAKIITQCPICSTLAKQTLRQFLIPKHGFRTAAWDLPKRSNDIERIGSVEQATITFTKPPTATEENQIDFASIQGLSAHYRENGELLVYNEGENQSGFAICLKCGYANSEIEFGEGRMKLPPGFEKHAPLTATNTNKSCWQEKEAPVLRNQTLAAKQTTDVLLLDFAAYLNPQENSKAIVETLAHALKLAGARLLELDSRELGSLAVGTKGGWGAVLYDNVPGGAGHVLELFKLGKTWLEKTQELMFINEKHHQHCKTACLDCLLTFDAQSIMMRGNLQRKLAYSHLRC
ncbi:DEAD/DEAH box helicase [Thioploca ingrica]|uniref:DEAD/DEAH box helicase n=1 Tax=Thioploca ingrica TaxID=40754 RepID=A0A090BV71_9GAMM|nr:DEAD/DEAH box helicase [Thioploca ingrica]